MNRLLILKPFLAFAIGRFAFGRFAFLRLVLFGLVGALALPVLAAPSAALGYAPGYADDFNHFDYVDELAVVGGTLRVASAGSFDSFNPFLLKSYEAYLVQELMFETLMEQSLDEPFSAYSLLAVDMRLGADGLSVEFDVDPLARFSNGDPVLAADVVYSFNTLISTEAHPHYRSYFRDVATVEALRELTVRFTFHRRNAELALILATGLPVFSPRWAGEEGFAQTARVEPISSGPYRIERHKTSKFIVYQRRSDYWGWHKPVRRHTYSFERIRVEYYFDLNIMLEAFKAGEYDIHHEYSSKQWARAYRGRLFDSGELVRDGIKHHANAGIQGFIFNLRLDKFKDVRVRRAITLAFDFNWANRSLFYGQYQRSHSYFSNSELAARGRPNAAESALLEPWRDELPAAVFAEPATLVEYDTPARLREHLIQARALLREAGWHVKDGRLVNGDGVEMYIEFLQAQAGFERIIMPFKHNLAKLGIQLKTRRVDRALYQRRVRDFDYDMIVTGYPASESPGNELYSLYGSASVDVPGSQNYAGIGHPAVDDLIEKVVTSRNRTELVTATRALDRVLWSLYLMVPNWYTDSHRLAWNADLARPRTLPKYYRPIRWVIQTWWWQP
ncbi:MAG: extracellular solute-binding protein [Gammaproteobacteria bacterium]|nr:extracellular solute-binding protein [Gammaproteobacteria bacterium]